MNFFADESVDFPIVEQLRADGHRILAVIELSPGISDDEVLRRANEHSMMLITGDKDFGELVFRLKRISSGVILIRLSGLPARTKALIVSDAIQKHGSEMRKRFTVIEAGNVRIRSGFGEHAG